MKKLLLFLTIAAVAFVSCTKNTTIPKQDSLVSLILKDTLQMYVGESENIPLSVSPGNYRDSLHYKSSDTSVVTISNIGVLFAKATGVSQIKISNLSGSKSITTKITVVPAPIDSLKLGLILYYPFDSNTTDSSGLGNNGTGYNITPVADRFGKANSAYHFDGFTSYITAADNLYLRLYETSFTTNAWVKLDDYNSSYGSVILGKRVPGIADAGYTFSIGGKDTSSAGYNTKGFIHFGPGGGSLNNALGTKAVQLSAWHMVTSVYNYSEKTLTIYLDGILDNVTPNIAPPNPTVGAELYIGRDDPSLEDNGYFIDGALDDIRMYNRALAPAEIVKLYNLKY